MPDKKERHKAIFPTGGVPVQEIKSRMLEWSEPSGILLFLDSNNYPSGYEGYECLMATGAVDAVTGNEGDLLTRVQTLHDTSKDWLFGHIGYDFKNLLEKKLSSRHPVKTGFPLLHFFIPETVCYIRRGETDLVIESFGDTHRIFREIMSSNVTAETIPDVTFKSCMEKEEYVDTIEKLRAHIADGDCYEINFCNERFCADVSIDPLLVFKALNTISPAPFAAYYKLNDKFMMCASPERYIRKAGARIISQPIKGTAKRGADENADVEIKNQLRNSIKEQAENVMIVDLVRNDLARTCRTGSIQADELFGIYTYPQVHQMISTVSGLLNDDVPFMDVIRNSFPMGSMTGAPKHIVMQLTEQYELSRRELFSGTAGYIDPNGNFDFNVVIRSLFYNGGERYLNYQTGGAITYDSVPEQEWEEMRLKAWALERIFKSKQG